MYNLRRASYTRTVFPTDHPIISTNYTSSFVDPSSTTHPQSGSASPDMPPNDHEYTRQSDDDDDEFENSAERQLQRRPAAIAAATASASASGSGSGGPGSASRPPAKARDTYGIVDELSTTLWDLKDGPDGYTGKPPYPYLTLIRIALLSAEKKKLTLQELYDVLEQRYPFFKGDNKGWKNSIRHNLSLNKCFKKESRHVLDPGKGSYWYVDLSEEHSTPRVRNRRKTNPDEPAPAQASPRPSGGARKRKASDRDEEDTLLGSEERDVKPRINNLGLSLDLRLPSSNFLSLPSSGQNQGSGRHSRAVSAPSPSSPGFFGAGIPNGPQQAYSAVGHPYAHSHGYGMQAPGMQVSSSMPAWATYGHHPSQGYMSAPGTVFPAQHSQQGQYAFPAVPAHLSQQQPQHPLFTSPSAPSGGGEQGMPGVPGVPHPHAQGHASVPDSASSVSTLPSTAGPETPKGVFAQVFGGKSQTLPPASSVPTVAINGSKAAGQGNGGPVEEAGDTEKSEKESDEKSESEKKKQGASPTPGPNNNYVFPPPHTHAVGRASSATPVLQATCSSSPHLDSHGVKAASVSPHLSNTPAGHLAPSHGAGLRHIPPPSHSASEGMFRPAPAPLSLTQARAQWTAPPAQSPTRLLPSGDYEKLFSSAPFGILLDSAGQRLSRSGSMFGVAMR